MPETPSPCDVFQKLLGGITAGRYAELAGLYAEDAVVETVFEPVGPRRFEGRAVLRERFAQVAAEPQFTFSVDAGNPTTFAVFVIYSPPDVIISRHRALEDKDQGSGREEACSSSCCRWLCTYVDARRGEDTGLLVE